MNDELQQALDNLHATQHQLRISAERGVALRARVAELKAEVGGLETRLADSSAERDALAAELAELRAAVTLAAQLLDQKPSLFHQSLSNRLRALAAQPQGERGKALLAVVEAAREWVHNPSFDVDEALESRLRAALTAIAGARPGA